MGDSKKYQKPRHPWQKTRILEEIELKKEYGCKNKKEIWKIASLLRRYRGQARKLVGDRMGHHNLEKKQLLDSLFRLGLLEKDAKLDDVLSLTIKELMERRLQTLLLRKKYANTIKQARQMITHGFVSVGGKIITSPNELVQRQLESEINIKKRKIKKGGVKVAK